MLKRAALIQQAHNTISVHRLLQRSIYYGLAQEDAQSAFDTTVKLINFAFPKQVNSKPFLDRWKECATSIEHAMDLATRFKESSKTRKGRLKTSPELQELMKNCVWYLFEIGELHSALELLNTAYTMCPDKESLLYAHFCNSGFVILFELNDLKGCREKVKAAEEIRCKLLPENDLDLAATWNNLGQLESSEGRQEQAMAYLLKSESNRIQAGEEAALSLGLGHLIYGRCLFLQKNYTAARGRYDSAEAIFTKVLGPQSQFMAQ